MTLAPSERAGSRELAEESFPVLGCNYCMTDIQAAVGHEQLRRLPERVCKRRQIAPWYREALSPIPGLGLPVEPPWVRSNWQSFCVRLPRDVEPAAVMQVLLEDGTATRRAVMNAHEEPAYADLGRVSLPESERARGMRRPAAL